MKKRLLLPVLFVTFLAVNSCGESVIPNQCLLGGEIEQVVEQGEGRYYFHESLNEWVISYWVPGTIDSRWTGVICQTMAATIDFPNEGEVIFSGEFMDDFDRFQPSEQIGGEEFFYLNVTAFHNDGLDN